MDFHPSMIPVGKTYEIIDEKEASEAAEDMVKIGFANIKTGYRVLMPKDKKLAKRIGYIVTTGVNYWLRKSDQERDIRYWTYHHDKDHYAIVLISGPVLEELDL